MIRRTEALNQLERRYSREVLGERTYLEALAVFEALWRQALELNPAFPGAWRDDLEADLTMAHVLNGLPTDA